MMNRTTAMAVFDDLEQRRGHDQTHTDPDTGGPMKVPGVPIYTVRLTAGDDQLGDRVYRLRVTPGPGGLTAEDWQVVLGAAATFRCAVTVQNDGIELH
jgi:hypothetical protein